METLYFLGIDVSKKWLDLALTVDGKNFHQDQIENSAKSIKAYFNGLSKKISTSALTICMEHTGVYNLPLLDFLVNHDIRVCVEPALRIKQSQGMSRGKTDTMDAKRIATYAYKNREDLVLWQPQRKVIQRVKSLLVLRERLIKTKVQFEVPINESQEFIEPEILKETSKLCSKTIKALEADLERVEKAIIEIIDQDEALSQQYKLITSVPGIGKITALNLIISTGEFRRIKEAKKLACYAGVAPFEHSSGSSIRGKTRVSYMANMTLKKLLHLAAMSAIQCCDELKAFYRRKVDEGKNKMSVINAVRNKLISRVFSCIKNNRMYVKNYKHELA